MDKYLFLIRCYVGVAFEVYLRPGNSSQEQDQDGGKKKRKRGGADSGNAKKKSKRGSDSGVTPGTDDSEEKYPGLASYISMLEQGPLYPLDFDPDQPPADDGAGGSVAIPHGPDGLRYHILDLWIDEIEKVVEFEEGEDGERRIKGDVPMEVLLRPVETLKAKGMHKPVRTRAGETLDDERLVEWGVREKKAESESDEDEWAGFDD